MKRIRIEEDSGQESQLEVSPKFIMVYRARVNFTSGGGGGEL